MSRLLLVWVVLGLHLDAAQGQGGVTVSVSLEGDPDPDRGRVVLHWGNIRGSICDIDFNNNAARVICRMLGKSTSGATVEYFGDGNATLIMMSGLDCEGHEGTVENCTIGAWPPRATCGQGGHAGVICQTSNQAAAEDDPAIESRPTTTTTTTTPTTTPTTTTITTTLTTTTAPSRTRVILEESGRVVLVVNGTRGFICSDGFDTNDATVFCRSFGRPDTAAQVRNFNHTGGIIFLTNVRCTGREASLSSCRFQIPVPYQYCRSRSNIGISCRTPTVAAAAPLCVSSGFSSKIYGGVPAPLGSWPHMVRVFIRRGNKTKQCGGSVLNRNWILTAAHCLYNPGSEPTVLVLAGTIGVRGGVPVTARSLILHESFSLGGSHDIALIRLQIPLTFSSTIQPICVNTARNRVPTEDCYIAGWGFQSEDQSASLLSGQLRSARYPIVSDYRCSFAHRFNVNSNMCAGYANASSSICQGDSGGPLMCRRANSNQWVLWGLAVGGVPNGCGPDGYYTVWTEVAQYWSWISGHINNR